MNVPKILEIAPAAAVPGGELFIRWKSGDAGSFRRPEIHFQGGAGHLVSASPDLIVVQVPELAQSGLLTVVQNGQESNPYPCDVAELVASNLHPVANPALDPNGNLYTTLSGRRGEKVSHPLYCISSSGMIQALESEVINPTGIAFDSQGEMYTSSRQDGNIYQVNPDGSSEVYAKGMGIATGIAFDYEDNLYVGDRTGTVFKIDRKRQIFVFATLEPSVAAYHLAFDEAQNLYVTGPTTSSFDPIYRIAQDGNVAPFFTGLGRPQGMAFDIEGHLYVTASYKGRRGIVRIGLDGKAELAVAGINLVGLAFAYQTGLYLASQTSIYRLITELVGKPLP
jgi:hypothetical protein